MFNVNDYVYYRDKDGNTCPTIIQAINGDRVKIENLDGRKVWVKKSNCDLQSEWE